MKTQMNKLTTCTLYTGLILLSMVSTANAALLSRLGGQAIYDTERDITWLSNANLAASNTFGVSGINLNGTMNWGVANNWIAAMNSSEGTGYLGFTDWRMPTVLQPDVSCDTFALNCTGSEMGHLFYNSFGATAGASVLTTGNAIELAMFTNIQSFIYWSGAEYNANGAWNFAFDFGEQGISPKPSNNYVWAVRSGDVSAVPIPAAVWLFSSGLIGLVGFARRNQG